MVSEVDECHLTADKKDLHRQILKKAFADPGITKRLRRTESCS
jgi:hypothetical protein